eukprot:scaffold32111_cov62-Phaeocystis_antarctica.AAC.1
MIETGTRLAPSCRVKARHNLSPRSPRGVPVSSACWEEGNTPRTQGPGKWDPSLSSSLEV